MPTRVCSGAPDFNAPTACDQLQPRPHRPLGIVLMGLRIAEIHEDAVAHVLRHEPAEALHGPGDALLIGGNDLAQVLRVHPGGERRRTDEVREHHRDLATLCASCGFGSVGVTVGSTVVRSGKLRYRREQFHPVTEGNAEFLEVLDLSDGGGPRRRCHSRQSAPRIVRDRAFRATPQSAAFAQRPCDGRYGVRERRYPTDAPR